VLVAGILHDAVEIYVRNNSERLQAIGYAVAALNIGSFGGFPATGAFPALTGSFAALTASFDVIGNDLEAGGVTLKQAFQLPQRLPGVRLPAESELAAMARSAPSMAALEALAGWLGEEGRPVGERGTLTGADAQDAAQRLGIQPGYLPYLWEYALTSGWIELEDRPGGPPARAVVGGTARRWADGEVAGTLRAWSAVFAAVLAKTLAVAAAADTSGAKRLSFDGQGVALAVLLFLSRRTGLTVAAAAGIVRDGAIGSWPSLRARRAWHAWTRDHGDPAGQLLGELSALRAVAAPPADGGVIELTPLAALALREQLTLEGIIVPRVRPLSGETRAAEVVLMSQALRDAEFRSDFTRWVGRLGAEAAARELLVFAALTRADSRLAAVNLVRRIGIESYHPWLDAMGRPELRGYARIALSMMAADLPESSLPLVLQPDPGDMTAIAADLLALACGEDDPDPEAIAARFAEAVPPGEEGWVIGLMSQSPHPDVARLLDVLGRHHPDPGTAKDARRAARRAAKNKGPAGRDRVPARAYGR